MMSTSQKERARNTIPGGTEKKESSSKSLNDIKTSKRKSANNYPRRREKKGELLKGSKRHQKVKKIERNKTIPGGAKKKESSSNALNDIKQFKKI